jgi:hypothetical protein
MAFKRSGVRLPLAPPIKSRVVRELPKRHVMRRGPHTWGPRGAGWWLVPALSASETFAFEIARGSTAIDAYRAAGYRDGKGAYHCAHRLLRNVETENRIAEIRAKMSAKADLSLEDLARNLKRTAPSPTGKRTPVPPCRPTWPSPNCSASSPTRPTCGWPPVQTLA